VSHSGFISDVASILLGKNIEDSKDYKTGFCAITTFELDDDFKVINYEIGNSSHLE